MCYRKCCKKHLRQNLRTTVFIKIISRGRFFDNLHIFFSWSSTTTRKLVFLYTHWSQFSCQLFPSVDFRRTTCKQGINKWTNSKKEMIHLTNRLDLKPFYAPVFLSPQYEESKGTRATPETVEKRAHLINDNRRTKFFHVYKIDSVIFWFV